MAGREDFERRKDWAWKEFFRDPSRWWDNRSSKESHSQPDFKHKVTKEPLWMDSRHNPPWVAEELIRRRFSAQQMDDFLSPSLIQACGDTNNLLRGTRLHDELQKRGLDEKKYSDALATMYAKCGDLHNAQALLDKHDISGPIPWTALISGYARQGKIQNAFACFEQMQHKGIPPNSTTYTSILKVCAMSGAVDKGKQIHDDILKQGLLEHNVVLGTALLDMYAKCGALPQAQSVLDELPSRNVVSWNALITGYAQHGQGQEALQCLSQMQCEGIVPDEVTYACILKACARIKVVDKGMQIHQQVLKRGLLERSIVLGNALVDMYAKCGALPEAQSVLESLPSRNVVSWNALIGGYAQKGHDQQALQCFEQMQCEGILPNAVSFVCILKACAAVGAKDKGKQIHEEISKQGLLEHNVVLNTALVDMYAKCGDLVQAQSVLEDFPYRNVVSWNALIAGYAEKGQGEQALECFEQMQSEGILPNVVTYLCILKGCAAIGAIDKGKQIHEEVLKEGLLEDDVKLNTALLDMYAKCGALPQAQSVLEKFPSPNVVSWNALITGYVQQGQAHEALECLEQMQCKGIVPNEVTYVYILKACARIGAVDKGKQIHDEISKQGLLEDNIVLGTALADMYAKCGALPQAQTVLEKLSSRDVVSWNALIAGYAQKGQGQQALECYELMQREGIVPDATTYVCILKSCAGIRDLDKGKLIHDEISNQGLLQHNVVLSTALLDMYAKCGDLLKAQSVLEELPLRSVVSWNALITGYAQIGEGQQALECFDRMQCEGILPNAVTFLCLLNLCSHLGLIEKGQELFDSMEAVYGLKPDIDCFTCMVDLLGRAGHLVRAVDFIQGMPISANSAMWHCLLGACQKWVDVDVGTWAFEKAVELDNRDGAAYVSMVNIYAAAGMHQKAKDIEAMRIKNKAPKVPGFGSYTDPKKAVLEFCVADRKHAQSKEIDVKIREIACKALQEGHYTSLNWVSRDLSHVSQAHLLYCHSEKLALASPLISTSQVDNIITTNRFRRCGECHTAMSFTPKVQRNKLVTVNANMCCQKLLV